MLNNAKPTLSLANVGETLALSANFAHQLCGTIDRSRVALRTNYTNHTKMTIKQKNPAFLRGFFVLHSVYQVPSAIGNKSDELKQQQINFNPKGIKTTKGGAITKASKSKTKEKSKKKEVYL